MDLGLKVWSVGHDSKWILIEACCINGIFERTETSRGYFEKEKTVEKMSLVKK